MARQGPIRLFLCGDVMTGRGVDQILPHPGDPMLHESYVHDARDYVTLAERAHGPIARPADFDYVWGDALDELRRFAPDARIVNLETSITASPYYWPDKGIHYRMSPDNMGCLTAAGIDCCCLANNHILDWGYQGLEDTMHALHEAGIRTAGAGQSAAAAAAPAIIETAGRGRVLVWAVGCRDSGIDHEWAATAHRPGIRWLAEPSEPAADRLAAEVAKARRRADLAVVSVHWGGNWGHDVPEAQVLFARRLVDGGVDVVCGHSSHHAKALEVRSGAVILYGCGDFLNHYEGIVGYEEYRGDLALMYLATFDRAGGQPVELRLAPMQMRRLRLGRASRPDAQWLADTLSDKSARFSTAVSLHHDGTLIAHPRESP